MKTLFSIVLGSAILLISIGLSSPVAAANASSLFVHVPVKEVHEGDRITVDVNVKSTEQAINAVSGTIIFPDSLIKVVSVSKEGSIINLWTREPTMQRNRILFEGIVLNPGFQGASGDIFHITFEAKRAGKVSLTFTSGAVLANDGYGSNIASTLSPGSFMIAALGTSIPVAAEPTVVVAAAGHIPALPVITEYSANVDAESAAYIKGKGEPNAFTKIVFKDSSFKSIGEQFITFLQTKRKNLDEVIVKNSADGLFEYQSQERLVAGAYSATPYLIDSDTQTEKPGLGVQLFVNDSKIVRMLIVLINVLALLIPVVGLVVVIYFIPWYSFRRMRLLKRKLGLEEEKYAVSQHALERRDAPFAAAPVVSQAATPRIQLAPAFPQRPFPAQEEQR